MVTYFLKRKNKPMHMYMNGNATAWELCLFFFFLSFFSEGGWEMSERGKCGFWYWALCRWGKAKTQVLLLDLSSSAHACYGSSLTKKFCGKEKSSSWFKVSASSSSGFWVSRESTFNCCYLCSIILTAKCIYKSNVKTIQHLMQLPSEQTN